MIEHPGSHDKGFTLIELIIVIAIIGILAAIAVPQYSAYKTRAYNAAAIEDLKAAEAAQELYFTEHYTYCANTSTLIGATYMLFLSDGVRLTIDPMNTNTHGFLMRTRHQSGDVTYRLQGPGGRVVEE
ncbi:MAG: pilus assembly protein [Deltaproteobacteria bacterium]|nr:MAG: pilus assembly protein [Deltaproteobacteria bacterium]